MKFLSLFSHILLVLPLGLAAAEAPALSPSVVEDLLLSGRVESAGLEDVVAWLRLTKAPASNQADPSNAATMRRAAVDDFAARFPDSPYVPRLGMLRTIALYESRPFAEILEARMPRADAQAFYGWLKNRQRWAEAAEFLERRCLGSEKPAEWAHLVGDLTTIWKRAGTNFTQRVLSNTNDAERYAWGRFFYRADRFPECVRFLESVAPTRPRASNEPPNPLEEAHYYLGVAESKRLGYEKADGHFRRFLGVWPDAVPDKENPRAWARFYHIENLERLSRWDEAWAEATNALAKTSEERYLRLVVRMAKALGRSDYPEWRKKYLDLYPGSWSAYINSRDDALNLLVKGKREEGLALLSKVYRGRPAELRMLVSILSNTNQAAIFRSNAEAAFDYFYFNPRFGADFPFPLAEREKLLEEEKARAASNAGGELPKAGRGYMISAEEQKWKTLIARGHPFGSWTNAHGAIPPSVSRRVKILLALGEASFAEQALRRAPFASELERQGALRAFYALSGDEDRALKSELIPIDSRREEWNIYPHEILRRAFPRWREELVLYFSRMYKVPPHLAWAVMREESHFNADAVSSAGAMGLMQIMDSTGRGLYAGAALSRLQKYDLKDPVLSVHLGIRYIAYLLRFFKGDEVKALAGYNGGEYNVQRWAKNNGPFTGSIHFALMIPYDETERYVMKVLRSKWLYDVLYGDE